MDDQILNVVTAAIFLAIFVLTPIDLVRYRTRMHLEVALLFGSLAGILALSGLSTVTGIKLQRTGIVAVFLVVLQPYLLVRLVDYFRPISRRQPGIAVCGFV